MAPGEAGFMLKRHSYCRIYKSFFSPPHPFLSCLWYCEQRILFVRESEPDTLMFPSFQLSVVASQRAATTETLKYPDKTTLIHKVLLYMNVWQPNATWSTHINTGKKNLAAWNSCVGKLLPRSRHQYHGWHGKDNMDSTDTLFWF